ncbi:hypothetical protein AMS68_005302 [Peltaster fructicola]|uniref:Transcription factor TFIIIC triple barrel domain-containing protein n=1 Tax=Peltaster fructicola TaxID=286661 RepID=A0A6H0XYN9_9PEZI|nr:hypothetical protein AMS68_005302 [Peltaster fructicola]
MRSDGAHVHQTSVQPVIDAKAPVWFEDDSDWEYEYDEHAYEDFYVTLDLTTHVPDALTKRETAKNGKWARGTMEARVKKTTVKKPAGSLRELSDISTATVPSTVETPAADTGAISESVEASSAPPPEIAGKIQIIGLHTANPYIVYNGTFYTAYWLTTLGSELWISRPGITKNPIFRGHVLDILGGSRARLMARSARLEPRDVDPGQKEAATAPREPPIDDDLVYEGVTEAEEPRGPLTIPESSVLDPSMRAHAAFMTRFAAVKWQKGERDQVPLHSIKHYEIPANADEIRKKAIEAEEGNDSHKRQKLDTASPHLGLPLPRFGPRLPPINDPAERRRAQRQESNDQGQAHDTDGDQSDIEMRDTAELIADGADDSGPVTANKKGKGPMKHQARNARLESLGVRDPNEPRPPRRKRRSKAEMQEARAKAAEERAAKWSV